MGHGAFLLALFLVSKTLRNGLADGRSGHSIEVEASLRFFRSVH